MLSSFGSLRIQSPAFGVSLWLMLDAPDKARRGVPSSCPRATSKGSCHLHRVADKAACAAQRLLSANIYQADQRSCVSYLNSVTCRSADLDASLRAV